MRPLDREPNPPSPRASAATSSVSSLAHEVEIVTGLRACLAVLAVRAPSIRGAWIAPERRDEARELFARLGRLAREATPGELDRVAGTSLHEGVVLLTAPRRWASGKELRALMAPPAPRLAIALDRVRNPYNVGSILRSAAFFGVDAAVLGALAPHPGLTPDAVRVAEGGAEHLLLSRTTDLAGTLAQLRASGVRIYGAEADGAFDALSTDFVRPAVLVVGHEREGLSPRVREQCDAIVAVRGRGKVESLNVAIAASLVLARM